MKLADVQTIVRKNSAYHRNWAKDIFMTIARGPQRHVGGIERYEAAHEDQFNLLTQAPRGSFPH
jgi:hypothetical protein